MAAFLLCFFFSFSLRFFFYVHTCNEEQESRKGTFTSVTLKQMDERAEENCPGVSGHPSQVLPGWKEVWWHGYRVEQWPRDLLPTRLGADPHLPLHSDESV